VLCWRRTSVPAYQRTDVPAYRRTDVPAYRRTGAPTHDSTVEAGRQLIQAETIAEFTRVQQSGFSSRALGWDTPSENSSAGSLLSARAFGHTGFTGTSIWVDPERDLFIILLTNRVYPTRENNLIRDVRRQVADLAVEAVGR